jgi:beta-phosphoglucomutase-like phosphatase (HAD superfamily)
MIEAKGLCDLERLLIFDFDGVIADSEVLANSVLAEMVSELGVPTTLEDAFDRYMGRRSAEVVERIERDIQRPIPDNFSSTCRIASCGGLERISSRSMERVSS